jgi:hypothetical protein
MDGHGHNQDSQQVSSTDFSYALFTLIACSTDNTVRIVKMTNVDGEYIALGRQTAVTGVALTQFGSGQATQFNVTGSGIQENEFSDGIRMSVRASQPMTVNLDVRNGISTTMLSALSPGTQSVSKYLRCLPGWGRY